MNHWITFIAASAAVGIKGLSMSGVRGALIFLKKDSFLRELAICISHRE